MKKHNKKIIAGAIIAIVLVLAFWYGGEAPGLRGWTPEPKETASEDYNDESTKIESTEAEKSISDIPIKEENVPATEAGESKKQDETAMISAEKTAEAEKNPESVSPSAKKQNKPTGITTSSAETKQSNKNSSEEQGMMINEVTDKGQYQTASVPEEKPVPIEPEKTVITDKELTCTLSVRCDTILQNIGWLDSEKVDIVPKDGVIYAEKSVIFYEGESVFNLLVREMKRSKIHMEFENTPIYNSAYIEGIANLYEFDCGELSGWMYKVNDWFPNYGCSRYQLKAGDKVEWVYTCDMGNDVGGQFAARNGN